MSFRCRAIFFCLAFSFSVTIAGLLISSPRSPDLIISIEPAQALFGTPYSMTISGLKPGEQACLRARAIDYDGTIWESRVTIRA